MSGDLENFSVISTIPLYPPVLYKSYTLSFVVVTKPPYQINESGYASFGLKLEIHFSNHSCRNGENIIHYEYDLYLPGEGQPSVKSFRQERLLIKTPPPEFRLKLLAGGAVSELNFS